MNLAIIVDTSPYPVYPFSAMQQMSMFQPEKPISWTVTDLTQYVRDLLESDYNLQDVWVSGEVSNFSQPRSGHLYFTLKDESASLRVVMWRSAVNRLRFLPRDGDAVEVHGKIGIYEASGQYQLYADAIRPVGEGVLYREFLRLKAMLEAEGLFDEERKRPIPTFPRRIGLVTSPTGAALQDMLNTLRRRFPLVDVVLAPTMVQGDAAPPRIVQALLDLNQYTAPDVIIVARGGGSIEDLWAFNDEYVARAIAASGAPVITGIGHETDFTIADFVADLRAPTPTAAAELATPDRVELRQDLFVLIQDLQRNALAAITDERWVLGDLQVRLRQGSPDVRIRSDIQRLDEIARRADRLIEHQLQLRHVELGGVQQRLASLNPLAILQRGYAVITHESGEIVRSVAQVDAGDTLDVRVSDGVFGAHVLDAKEERKP